jgi:PAS domain S-box-containing protein
MRTSLDLAHSHKFPTRQTMNRGRVVFEASSKVKTAIMLADEKFDMTLDLPEEYRFIFGANPLPMWIFDIETLRFLHVNDAAIAQYGYSRDEFRSMTIEDIRPVEAIPRLKKLLLQTERPLNYSANWKHRRKDGRHIDVDIFSNGISVAGRAARIVVALDVTERNAAEEQLRHTSKLESLGRLTGGVAHDFNNILAIIQASMELASEKFRSDSESVDLLRRATTAIERGAQLTKSLLAYAREQSLAPSRVSLGKVLQEMTPLIENCIGSGIEFDLHLEESTWPVNVDVGQLQTAILNLARNARDAMSGGGLFSIHCGNVALNQPARGLMGEIRTGEYVVITVSDTGAGMTTDVVVRATEPFFTTKHMTQATGLGLSMVYGFLRQSDGYLEIQSQPSQGTAILLYLLRDASYRDPPIAPEPPSRSSLRKTGERETILIVEDEPDLLILQSYFLESLGYSVLTAKDGPSALQHLRSSRVISLLLTDVILPEPMSGPTVAAEAQALTPGIKVLYISGYTKGELIEAGKFPTGVSLINKPFYLEELANAIGGLLNSPQSDREVDSGRGEYPET